MTTTPPGWYHAHGDPPDTIRYWDGTAWVGEPAPAPPGWQDPHAAKAAFGPPGKRIVAAVIDGLVQFLFLLPWFIPYLGDVFDDIDAGGDGTTVAIPSEMLVVGLVVTVVYIAMVARLGATPGKFAMGLRVTTEDGATTPPGAGKAILRWLPNILAAIPVLGQFVALLLVVASLIMVFNDDERRSVFDRAGNTRVISVR